MNTEDFYNELKNISKTSYGYGNEILYKMGEKPTDLKNKEKLSGAIWLIGRSYAASPQRRSYGTFKYDENGKQESRAKWPVKTQNDGREGFFDDIAGNLNLESLAIFRDLIENYHEKNLCYKFKNLTITRRENKTKTLDTCSIDEDDKKLLIESITAVLAFNKVLGEALEKFDEVPDTKKYKNERYGAEYDVKCNSHISFASKFLHFYFPNIIFIIDNFAYNGASALLSGNISDKQRYIVVPPTDKKYFEQDVYDRLEEFGFCSDVVRKLSSDIKKEVIEKLNDLFPKNTANDLGEHTTDSSSVSDDNKLDGSHYISHCVKSYLMGVFAKENTIEPAKCIKEEPTFCPASRLTDAIFLNIKKPLTETEKNKQDELKKEFPKLFEKGENYYES